jgi:PIN domain nuclease of toxin-antitoxin system
VRLLLDTHSFLWFVLADAQLSAAARAAISDPANEVFISPATYWEIAIKVRTGKYALAGSYLNFVQHNIDANDFDILPIEVKHTAVVAVLPFHHRDPFDRLLIAQALVEDLTLVSNESLFDSYGVKRLW